jgi:hypothetical protein
VIRYEHTQIGYLIIGGLFGIAIFLAITGIVAPAGQGGLLISASIEAILLICAIVFSKLTIKIDGVSFGGLFRNGTYSQESAAGGDCRMRTASDSLVVRLGNSPNAVRLALQCFWFGCCSDQAALRPKVRAGH